MRCVPLVLGLSLRKSFYFFRMQIVTVPTWQRVARCANVAHEEEQEVVQSPGSYALRLQRRHLCFLHT